MAKMTVPALKYWIMYFSLGKYKLGNTHNTCCLLYMAALKTDMFLLRKRRGRRGKRCVCVVKLWTKVTVNS